MTLYDSYGKLIEIDDYSGEDYLCADRLFEQSVREKIDEALPGNHYQYMTDRDVNRLDIYMMRDIPSRIGGTDKFDGTERHICGLCLYRNPADGKVCGMGYFSCTLEEYEKDSMNIYPYRSERRNLICMSGTDTQKFPEMEKLYKTLISEYDLEKVKIESMYRDTYIYVNENGFRFKSGADYSKLRWDSYNAIKKNPEIKKAFYKENRIYFQTKTDIEGRAVITDTADGLKLECMGNFYDTPEDLMDDFIAFKGEDPFGKDEDFRKYYKDGIKLPEGEHVFISAPEYIPPFRDDPYDYEM